MLPPVLLHGDGDLSLGGLGVVDLVHPVLEVLAGVCSAGLLPLLSSDDDL